MLSIMATTTLLELGLEGTRGEVDAQSATLDDLRARAATILTADAVVAALLGTPVFGIESSAADGWTRLGMGFATASVLLLGVVLLPVWKWRFLMNADDVLKACPGDQTRTMTTDDVTAIISVYKTYKAKNEVRLEWMMRLFIGAGLSTVACAVSWLVQLAHQS